MNTQRIFLNNIMVNSWFWGLYF